MKYGEIKEQRQNSYNRLFDTCGVFWAFSNEQFAEGKAKHPLQEGEKYLSIGAGGYLPKHNADKLTNGIKEIEKTFKAQIKEAKARVEHIVYELNNHECYYTGDITPAIEALGEDYTAEEVEQAMKKYKANMYKKETGIDYLVQTEDGTIHKINEEEAETIKNNMESQD